jgi:hypothetical protein
LDVLFSKTSKHSTFAGEYLVKFPTLFFSLGKDNRGRMVKKTIKEMEKCLENNLLLLLSITFSFVKAISLSSGNLTHTPPLKREGSPQKKEEEKSYDKRLR